MAAIEEIRVAIIEDDRPTREGLGLLIDATHGYRCVGKFNSVEEALRLPGKEVPQVLLLDIHLPGMLGSEGVKRLLEKYPSVKVLMLTVYAEQEKVFESICNGACGYLLKKTPPAKPPGSDQRGSRGRRPDVAGDRPQGRRFVSEDRAARK